jgi:hypothetical protein
MKFDCAGLARAAAVSLVVLVSASWATAADEPLDYKKIRDALPIMRDISDRGAEANLAVHEKMDRLLKTDSQEEALAVRKQLAADLEKMLAAKREMVAATKDLLALPRSALSDQEIFDTLTERTFNDVHWANANFDKCMRDISREVGVPIRLHYRVVQKNKVTFDFQRTRAEAALAFLCNGFDLRYLVYDGEIIVYKKITPTEERFLEYQKKHPDVELRYWDREKADGDYDVKKKQITDAEAEKNAQRWSLDTLDLGLLHENLLKIHIVEASSERHNQRLIAKTSFEAMTADSESTGASGSSQICSARTVSSSVRMAARSSRFLSSRMLPRRFAFSSSARASWASRRCGRPMSAPAWRRSASASGSRSRRRSRRGGSLIGKTASRW